jgi:hypothetical protein
MEKRQWRDFGATVQAAKTAFSGPTTGAGLRDLRELESLALDGSTITDDGLKELTELKNLKHLGLSNTGIMDAGLKVLGKLSASPALRLKSSKVTEAGRKALKSECPELQIDPGSSRPEEAYPR